MTVIGEAWVDIKAKADNFGDEAEGKVVGAVKKIAIAAGGVFAAQKIFEFGKGAFDAAIESQKIGAQTEAVIKSTGMAAGISAKQIGDMATALSKKNAVDDEAIQQGQNLLLTFTNIQNKAGEGNDVFDQATQSMIDMAAAMGTDVKGGAIQLGKALNDPIAGIAALTRVGVTFTDEQKAMIKALVESGDVMGAQKVILAELNKEFGGSAEAQATATDRLKISMGNLQEEIGAKLIPVVERFSAWMVAEGVPAIEKFIAAVGPVVQEWMPRLQAAIGFVVDHWQLFAAAILILGGPITATIAAIALVVAHLDTFRNAIDSTMNFIMSILATVERFWDNWGQQITAVVMGVFTIVRSVVESAMLQIQGIINIVMGLIHGDFSQVWEGIRQIFESVWVLIRGIVEGALSILTGLIDATMKIISGLFDAAWSAILAALDAAWEGIKSLVMAGVNAVVGFVTDLPGKLVALGGMFVAAGVSIIDSLWDGLKNVIGKMADLVAEVISALAALPGKAAGVASQAGFYIIEAIGQGLAGIAGKMGELAVTIINALIELPGRVMGWTAGIGQAILNGIVNGIGDVGGAIWDKISGGIMAIPGKIGGILSSIPGVPGALGGNFQPVPAALGGNFVRGYGAGGTTPVPGGLMVVGERGPELMHLGGSAAIFPNNIFQAQLIRALQAAGGGGSIININIMIESVSAGNASDVARKVAVQSAQALQAMGIGVGVRQGAGR